MRKNVLIAVLIFIIGVIIALILLKPKQRVSDVDYTRDYLSEHVAQLEADTALPKAPVTLFFPDTSSEYLRKELRALWDEPDTNIMIKQCVEALIAGPVDTALVPAIPAGVRVLALYTVRDKVVVDFSEEFVRNHPGGSNGEIMTIYSIVNTILYNFPKYKYVQILVDGKVRDTIKGHIDISQPINFNPDFVYPELYSKDFLETH